MNREDSSGQEWTPPLGDSQPEPGVHDAIDRALANIRERDTEGQPLFGLYRRWTKDLFAQCPDHAFSYARTAQADRATLLALLDALITERDHLWRSAACLHRHAQRLAETGDHRAIWCAGQSFGHSEAAQLITEGFLSGLDLWTRIEFDRIVAHLTPPGTAADQPEDAS